MPQIIELLHTRLYWIWNNESMALDDYEEDILKAYEQGEMIQVKDLAEEVKIAQNAAGKYLIKNSKLNDDDSVKS